MNALRTNLCTALASVALFVPACGGGDDDEGAHTIPEANAEDPLPADTDYQGHHVGVPDFYRIDVPSGHDSFTATLQYSRAEFPVGQYFSLTLVREDASFPDIGWTLAATDDDSSESLVLGHTFPDTAGGRYYVAIFTLAWGNVDIVELEVDYTVRWYSSPSGT